MGAAYPELTRAQTLIEETLRLEETRFRVTLARGLAMLDDEARDLRSATTCPATSPSNSMTLTAFRSI